MGWVQVVVQEMQALCQNLTATLLFFYVTLFTQLQPESLYNYRLFDFKSVLSGLEAKRYNGSM